MRELRRRIAGVLHWPWRVNRAAVAGAAALVAVLGLISLTALVGPPLLERFGLIEQAKPAVASPPRLALRPLPADAPAPTEAGLAAALASVSGTQGLGTLTGIVQDSITGEVLWSRDADRAMMPGSTVKVLTAAAVLLTMDPTTRIPTRVVAGETPDSVVLVGGGDPTLSALPKSLNSVYPGAARLDALAAAVRAVHPGPIRSVAVDVSRFTGEQLAPGWDPADIADGYVTPIQALTLDGGRSKPDELDPPRTATPAIDAGRALARRLGADPGQVRVELARPGARVLGEVMSPTIGELVETALRISDNVLAEALARQVALARGEVPSFAGAVRAIRDTLVEAGFNVGETRLTDGSGLSTLNQVPARLLGEIMAAAAGPATDTRAARLRPLLAGLPVAGGDGTLADRFDTDLSGIGRGFVRAKTGTLTGVSSLAGLVTSAEGRLLTFALMSNGVSPAESRPRLDAIAATLHTCGCR